MDEILRCGRDPVYFVKKYCKIQHPTRGTIPFETYPFQDSCLRAFQEHNFNIVLKSRQLGLSTITAAHATWLALFRRDKNILVIASKLRTAKTFIRKVRKFLACLPPWLRLAQYEESMQEIRFDNGSQIVAVPTAEDAGRSEALSLLIVDEAAIIRNLEEIWGALFPTLSEGGSAIVLSTPNGVGGKFHDLWIEAEAKHNGFHAIKLPWDVHPEHDQEWFEKTAKKLGPRLTSQELCCDFLSSGETFLQRQTMEWIGLQMKAPLRCESVDDGVWVWEDPIPNHKYLIAADVSRGDSSDFSAFVGIDMLTGNEAFEYQGKVFPDVLAELVRTYGSAYNNALVCVEANTYGHHTNVELRKKNYPNLFYQTAPRHSVENYYPTPKDRVGFSTQAESRAQAFAMLEDCMRYRLVVPASTRFHEELKTFVWLDDKPQAKQGKHDDITMAMAIACWVYRTYFDAYARGRNSKVPVAAAKPLFAYMTASSRVFSSVPRPPGPTREVSLGPSSMVRLDKPTTPQATVLDPKQLRWLL